MLFSRIASRDLSSPVAESGMPVSQQTVDRDTKNASLAQKIADQHRREYAVLQVGAFQIDPKTRQFAEMRRKSLEAIYHNPFHVMVEVEVELRNGDEKKFVWYGHEGVEVNAPLPAGAQVPVILSWTHPGLQAALATDLDDQEDLSRSGLNIVAVTPFSRARFRRTLPEISGMYEPGGGIGLVQSTAPAKKAGLKAVKLNMTREQVRAFTSHMQGILLVTGAPGSGKTTIAYQRVRFLLDQQQEASGLNVTYDLQGTRILLANKNLKHYSQNLLRDELSLDRSLVTLMSEFLEAYVAQHWSHKWGAREVQRTMARQELRGRDAIFGLMNNDELLSIWTVFENQIKERLSLDEKMPWVLISKNENQGATKQLQQACVDFSKVIVNSLPTKSSARMDRLYASVQLQYLNVRKSLPDKVRTKFESEFAKWLFFVFDPIASIKTYLDGNAYRSKTKIDRGIAGRGDAEAILGTIQDDIAKRHYTHADLGMIAFLLRFALPEQIDPAKRFMDIPSAWPDENPWTHLAIDEAQDLSAPEAALAASLVDPRGALTISADFRQRVSATHGIESPDAILTGCQISTSGLRQPFRFAVNKRQTPQIGRFLKSFYEVAFGEVPPFDVDSTANYDLAPPLPDLHIADHQNTVMRLRQLSKLPGVANGTVAVLQINEIPEEKLKIEGYLREIGVEPVAPIYSQNAQKNQWILATVEEIKGLEFDTCFVFGLDSVDAAELEYNRNRAYVGLSRPAQRLVIFCHEFPMLLRGVDSETYRKTDKTK
jgi:GTPase SAR1 family protein